MDEHYYRIFELLLFTWKANETVILKNRRDLHYKAFMRYNKKIFTGHIEDIELIFLYFIDKISNFEVNLCHNLVYWIAGVISFYV